MPQPLGDGYVLQYHPKLLKDRPQHAAGIGLVAAEWAALEEHLIFACGLCLFSSRSDDARKVTEAAWYSIDGLNSRLKLLMTLARPRIPEERLEHFQVKIIPEIRKRAAERNRIVHACWAISDKHPDDLILQEPVAADCRRYSVNDFEQIADRIIDTSNALGSFWLNLDAHLRHVRSPQPAPLPQFAESPESRPTQPDKSPP